MSKRVASLEQAVVLLTARMQFNHRITRRWILASIVVSSLLTLLRAYLR